MQLPRGKFRSVIKGVALNSLIQELAEVRYTGVITISWNHEVISIVMQRGRYILAEFGSLRGDRAWEGVTGLGESTIDAILSDFSEAELKLAMEFNEACLLQAPASPRPVKQARERPPPLLRAEAPRPAPAPAAPVPDLTAMPKVTPPPASPPLSPPVALVEKPVREPVVQVREPSAPVREPVTTVREPVAPAREPVTTVREPVAPVREPVVAKEEPALPPSTTWTQVDLGEAMAAVSEPGGTEGPGPGGYDELALLHMEMSALDDVDVEHIATKIRKNARGIVKKLHLGHLMTEKEE